MHKVTQTSGFELGEFIDDEVRCVHESSHTVCETLFCPSVHAIRDLVNTFVPAHVCESMHIALQQNHSHAHQSTNRASHWLGNWVNCCKKKESFAKSNILE